MIHSRLIRCNILQLSYLLNYYMVSLVLLFDNVIIVATRRPFSHASSWHGVNYVQGLRLVFIFFNSYLFVCFSNFTEVDFL